MSDQDAGRKHLLVKVSGQPPNETAPAVFANFVAVSRIGGQVQLEFIYVDVNLLAQMFQNREKVDITSPPQITGKTVVKVVMPTEAFSAVQDHMEKIFADINQELLKHGKGEENDARKRATS